MLISGNTWLSEGTDREDTAQDDDLEMQQSPGAEGRRFDNEGWDADLTELAAPKVAPEHETGDDLEQEEFSARTDTNTSDSAALAEVAAPEPIAHRDSSKHTSSKQQDAVKHSAKGVTWTEMTTVSWLVFFSLLGTLARLGVEAISTYPYATVPSTVLWANAGGSFLMGFLLEDRRLFRYFADSASLSDDKEKSNTHIDKSKKVLPLYIGLTTGFCGSFTSFSTFITDGFLSIANELAPPSFSSPYHTIDPASIQPRNGGYSFMAVIAVVIVHPAVSIAALKTGAHMAVGLESITPMLPSNFVRRFLDPLAVVLGVGCWVGALLLCIWPVENYWRGRATMALVFAPLGTLSRFYVSRYLNARIAWFPLGTFAINIIGTCVEGACYDIQHTRSTVATAGSGAGISCAVLEGVMQGFCGCATTVSTWVVELNGLRRRHAWFYGLASVVVALSCQIVIMGSVAWTKGFNQNCDSVA